MNAYLYSANIAGELVMSTVLIFLLLTYFIQQGRIAVKTPLFLLASVNLLLLFCQVAEWTLMIMSGDQTGRTVPAFYGWKIFTYVLDYALGYFSSLAFFYFVQERIREAYFLKHIPYPPSRFNWMRFLVIWGIPATALFTVLMTQDWFYFMLDNGRETFSLAGYFPIYLMATAIIFVSLAMLIRHREVLGKRNFLILLFYEVTPTGLLLEDLILGTCLTYLMRAFYTFILYIHMDVHSKQLLAEQKAQLALKEKELVELRTQIMLSQMQPHFLYNTLTTISGLCYLGESEQAREVVDKLADYLRENLDSMGKNKIISFEKELEHIQTYLWIEQVRFGKALSVKYLIGPRDFTLPSLTLQPLVENAVKHGIRKKKGGGTVSIETTENPKEYLVIIQDDGAGFDPSELPNDNRSHVGIENITKRLELLCGGSCDFSSQKGVGTTVVVHLPKEVSPWMSLS